MKNKFSVFTWEILSEANENQGHEWFLNIQFGCQCRICELWGARDVNFASKIFLWILMTWVGVFPPLENCFFATWITRIALCVLWKHFSFKLFCFFIENCSIMDISLVFCYSENFLFGKFIKILFFCRIFIDLDEMFCKESNFMTGKRLNEIFIVLYVLWQPNPLKIITKKVSQ